MTVKISGTFRIERSGQFFNVLINDVHLSQHDSIESATIAVEAGVGYYVRAMRGTIEDAKPGKFEGAPVWRDEKVEEED